MSTSNMSSKDALSWAQSRFGEAARVRWQTNPDGSKTMKVGVMPPHSGTTDILGTGETWEDAIEATRLSPKFNQYLTATAASSATSNQGASPMSAAAVVASTINPSNVNAQAAAAVAAKSTVVVNPNIKTGLLGWDEEVTEAMKVAVYAGENVLIVGEPGGAKSLFARRFFNHFEGALFETQISKWADETALFGAPDLKALRESGEFIYPKRGLAASEYAFIDEIFDGSDVLLRTMLSCLQERKFLKGGKVEDIPLQMALATANYTRVNDVTGAVVDRFAITLSAPTLNHTQRMKLYGNTDFEEIPRKRQRVSIEEIAVVREKAKDVKIPESIVRALVSWASEMKMTPRRERKLAWILRVASALEGRNEINEQDIMAARFVVPLTAQGKIDNSKKTVQPLIDSIQRALYEVAQLKQVETLALPVVAPDNKAASLVDAIKMLKTRIVSLRAITSQSVADSVTSMSNNAIATHEANLIQMQQLLGI